MRISPVCPTRPLDPVARYRVDDWLVSVELRAVPDCPNLNATRDLLHACLAEAGVQLTVIERIGDYPAPDRSWPSAASRVGRSAPTDSCAPPPCPRRYARCTGRSCATSPPPGPRPLQPIW